MESLVYITNSSTTAGLSTSTWDTSTVDGEEATTTDDTVLFTTLNGQQITTLNLFFYLIQILVAFFILLLNGLVLDTMVRQGRSTEPADLLVAGLALTDVLTGLSVLWGTVYTVVYFQFVYECLARLGLTHSVVITGMLHLLCLTVDRFLKIVMPLRYNVFCQRRTIVAVMAAMWTLGIILGSLPMFGWNGTGVSEDRGDTPCSYFSIMNEDYLRLLVVVITSTLLVIAVLYIKLFVVARRHVRAIASVRVPIADSGGRGQDTGQWSSHKSVWRYTKTVLTIVGINCVSWLPMGTVVACSLTDALGNMSNARKGDLLLYTSTLVYCNSLVNPLIYAIKIPAIRARYRAFFCSWRHRKRKLARQITGTTTVSPEHG